MPKYHKCASDGIEEGDVTLALAISRRDMFKRVLSKGSLQRLSILLPGSLERLLGIDNVSSPGSAEEAGLALRRRRRGSSKSIWNTSYTNSDESKVVTPEESAPYKGNNS